MKKTSVSTGISLLFLVCLFLTLGCGAPREEAGNSDVQIRIGYNVQSLNYGPVMVAHEAGFLKLTGYDVKLVPVKSGKEVRQGLASGHIDVGLLSPTDIFMVVNAGAPVKIIGPLTVTTTHLFVRPEDRNMAFRDMTGKRIRGGRGGQSEFVFRWALKREGVDVSGMEFVHVDNIFRWVALVEKKIVDVVPLSFYGVPEIKNHGAVAHRDWVEFGYADEYWLNKVVAVNTNFLRTHQDGVGGFLRAMVAAQRFIETDRNDSAAMVAQHIWRGSQGVKKFTADDVLEMWGEGVRYVLWYDPNTILEMANIQHEAGIVSKKLNLDDVYDFQFTEYLKSAHMELYESEN